MKILRLNLFLLLSLLSACGGGGSGSSESSTSSSASSAPSNLNNENLSGLWNGTISEGGISGEVRGLVYDDDPNDGLPGDFFAISQEFGFIYLGSLATSSGDDVAASAGRFQIGGGYADQWTLAGVGSERGTIQATATSEFGNVASISLSYDSDYDRSSSLSKVSGTWDNYDNGNLVASMILNSNGTFSGTNTLGCSFSGTFSVINSGKNLYQLQVQFSNCGDANGTYAGYATLLDGVGSNDRIEMVYFNEQLVIFDEIVKR